MTLGHLRSTICVSVLCLLISATAMQAAAQEARPQIQEVHLQIENDVWKPLLAASNAFDADGFLAVQSRDLVRVALDAKQVYGLSRYETEIREGFARARTRGIARTSEVGFLERIVSTDLAHETGYFRSEIRAPNGEITVRYSRFSMVLRKEGGTWKILVDKDTRDGGTITEEMFRAATPLRQATLRR